MAVRDSTFCQVVWGKLHRHTVTGEDSDTVTAEFAGQMGENCTVGIQLNAKQTTRELFDYSPSYFNAIFFTQSSSCMFDVDEA